MFYNRNAVLPVCLVLTLATLIFASTKTAGISNDCNDQETCDKCIRKPRCVWCSEERNENKNDTRPRCMHDSVTNTKDRPWCSKGMIVTPPHYKTLLNNTDFSPKEDAQVQVKPQRVKMVLRAGKEETLTIGYRQAIGYPVDLYFLMDLSKSMEVHKNNLSKLGKRLAKEMLGLTTNVRLGFGSFVDKVLLPMTSTQEGWLEGNCKLGDTNQKCAPPYGYKHQMKLTKEYGEFQANVEAAPISANLDAPEGGLDAMMQAIVCWDKIGWRENARHIMIYASDSTYHIAGDGRLAGLIEPNDEKCHLNASGFYTHAEILDYPSISQIDKQARDNNINIIFAVVDKVQKEYETLSSRINISTVGVLDKNSNNVVELVRNNYKKLTNTVRMIDNATGVLELKYRTRCVNTNKNSPLQERKDCSGVTTETPLEFQVTIKAVSCPEDRKDWIQTISIQPEGVNERVIIEVELSCDCPCSRLGHEQFKANSSICHLSGNLTCGVCACNAGYYGKQCNCQGDDVAQQSTISEASCIKEGDTRVCSGRGTCACGTCKCEAGPNEGDTFSGEFCQCDNFSCKRFGGLVCGGPDRGTCECGVCQCKPGLGGDDCHCRNSNLTCIPPGENTKICNGFGNCVCGSCECTKEGRSGEFCDKCPTCPTQRCDELRDCVECLAYETGPEYEEGKTCPNCDLQITLVKDIDEDPKGNHSENIHICSVPDSAGCTFVFSYQVGGRGDTEIVTIEAEETKKCPVPPFSAYGVAGGAIGATLLLGLLGLLIWKVLTMFHDHREWVKFEKERVSAKWDRGENPLFKEPTTSFNNPTFGTKG